VTYVEGACLGIPAMTAMQAVYLAHIRKDSTVLVSGGAGSVGHYAIQLAKHRGGRVLSTVSNESKATHALQAGADEVINYRTENVASRVRQITKGRGADALIEVDLSGNAALYPSILAPHATVVVYGMSTNIANIPSLWMMQKSITLRLFLIYDIDATDRQQNIAHLHDCLTGRKLIHTVAKRLRLEEIAEAHDMVERGDIIGNIVLDIPEDS
jgi:NADPH:quinone reductase